MSESEPTSPSTGRPQRRRSSWSTRLSLPIKVLAEDELPEGLAEAGVYQSKKEAGDRGLVVLSMQLGYWLYPASEKRWRLAVRAKHLEAVRTQLEKFESEQVIRPQALKWPVQPTQWWLWTGWCAMLIYVHWRGGGLNGTLTSAGLFESVHFFNGGQFWRALTAQTLHADYGHLAGNLFGILLFGWVASRGVGAGFAILGAVVAGFLAFVGSGWMVWPGEYASLGASSTVFGLLGIVIGQSVLSGWILEWRGFGRSMIGPLLGGLAFLGMFGGGGEGSPSNTDLLAHLVGFLSGLPFGAAGALLVWRGLAGGKAQKGAILLTAVLMGAAWLKASL